MPSRSRQLRIALLAVVALALAATAGAYAATALRATDQPVVRTALAEATDPAGAPGRTLGLARVTVAPGGALALHRHPGTQTAYIQQGTLTYTVVRGGVVRVQRGNPESDPELVRTIRPGQTARLTAGLWIVERPGTIHRAANLGDERIVLYIASLFRTGAPPAIPVAR